MKTLLVLFTTTLVSLNVFAGTGDVDSSQGIQSVYKSIYTDLTKDCVEISSATGEAEIDFYSSECKAFGGYSLFIQGGDLRYHPTLGYEGSAIEIETPGAFHDVGSNKIEWVYKHSVDKEGSGTFKWVALIYRLSQASIDGEKDIQMLYVVRLDGAKSCLVGSTQSNVKAREMAYNSKLPCK